MEQQVAPALERTPVVGALHATLSKVAVQLRVRLSVGVELASERAEIPLQALSHNGVRSEVQLARRELGPPCELDVRVAEDERLVPAKAAGKPGPHPAVASRNGR